VTVKRSFCCFLLGNGHQHEAARMMGLCLVAAVAGCVSVSGTNLIWKAKFLNEIVKMETDAVSVCVSSSGR